METKKQTKDLVITRSELDNLNKQMGNHWAIVVELKPGAKGQMDLAFKSKEDK